jgi:F-type H+-transporting ATPase subunit b
MVMANITTTTKHIIQNTANHATEVATSHDVHATNHHGVFYEDPTFWVGLSTIIVFTLLAKPISKFLNQVLDQRAKKIEKQLNEAKNLKIEAEKLVQEYNDKKEKAEIEAEKIIKETKENIEIIKAKTIEKLNKDMEKKEADAINKIAMAESQVIKEVTDRAIEIAMEATKKAISEHLDDKQKDKLIEESIKNLPNKLKEINLS